MFVSTTLKIYRRMHLTYDSIRKHHKVLSSKGVLEVIVETYFHDELSRCIRAYVNRKLITIYRTSLDADRATLLKPYAKTTTYMYRLPSLRNG